MDELYPPSKTVMHGDIEAPLSLKPRLRDLAPISEAELRAFSGPVSPPRPVVTAYPGCDLNAYYPDAGRWVHCQSGTEWRP